MRRRVIVEVTFGALNCFVIVIADTVTETAANFSCSDGDEVVENRRSQGQVVPPGYRGKEAAQYSSSKLCVFRL